MNQTKGWNVDRWLLGRRGFKRVNPRPFPTHSTRESEWAKAEVVLKCCNSVFERNRVDLGNYCNHSLGTRPQPIRLGYITARDR
ncbi:hypothetical protein H5410_022314 [Solanum commersonii]|uniref:Uncharacterized protein n=1 Tax=Solanum commersonii TaxID=4109 RepID=A0A9J5ZDV1_SOLCO|nr:hypothetical protein H5410_022314 [Solanum commersonii]